MSEKADEIDETGFVMLKIAGADVRIDLWSTWNEIREIGLASKGQPPNVYNTAIVEYMKRLGYPEVSHQTGGKFVKRMYAFMESLEKKVESADTPSPTAS